ncbi:MAG: 2-methylcitrate dehydratase [Betaproteobacteria bacterium]|nr:2-methylcitrate dehydratase [Betaproteobacteria bacterium]
MNAPSTAAAPQSTPAAAAATDPSISQRIADFAAATTYERLPQRIKDRAKLHMLDVIGTALAATRFDFAHRALKGLLGLDEPGTHALIGIRKQLPLRDAVLLNGILAHGLDYDDTHPGAIVHPSSSAFPCALGMGEKVNASGADLLTAYVLGVDVATRVGVTAAGAMHTSGFHTTGIAGHFGCVVAAGKLLGLSTEQLTKAQGLAGSTASAVSEHRADGAWNKRMHPGWAGVGGITAALLARGGYLGTRRIYEGADGLFRSHTGDRFESLDLSAMTAALGEKWLIDEVAIKPFPICHLLHACADSALALRRKHGLRPEDISKVRALLHPETFHYVCEPAEMRRRPVSEYMAKFSVQYVVAACLVRGKFGFAELEPEALIDRDILALAQRVSHEADPESQFPKYFSGGVVITTTDGRELVHMEKINRGAGERALTPEDICAKFVDNAELVVSPARAVRIRDFVLEIERHGARDLAALIAG